jgi:hypothetical protein
VRQGALLAEVYDAVTACVRGLDEEGLGASTRTEWTVTELLFHLLLDAQRALVTLATPADEPPDTDAVTYWHDWDPSSGDGGAHLRFVRAAAAAYSSPRVVVNQWVETASAAAHAARTAPAEEVVRTQGHRLAVPDFLSTLVVEGAVHLLDLTAHVPGPPVPPGALVEVRRVLAGLLRAAPPETWSDQELALKGTGRLPLTEEDRSALGALADRFPLLG